MILRSLHLGSGQLGSVVHCLRGGLDRWTLSHFMRFAFDLDCAFLFIKLQVPFFHSSPLCVFTISMSSITSVATIGGIFSSTASELQPLHCFLYALLYYPDILFFQYAALLVHGIKRVRFQEYLIMWWWYS